MRCPACGHIEEVRAGDTLLWCSECGGSFSLPTVDGRPITANDADLLAREVAFQAREASLDIFEDEENPPWEM